MGASQSKESKNCKTISYKTSLTQPALEIASCVCLYLLSLPEAALSPPCATLMEWEDCRGFPQGADPKTWFSVSKNQELSSRNKARRNTSAFKHEGVWKGTGTATCWAAEISNLRQEIVLRSEACSGRAAGSHPLLQRGPLRLLRVPGRLL